MKTIRRPVAQAVASILFLLSIVALPARCAEATSPAPKPIELRVLYAGKPDSPRMKNFAAFLEGHFAKVTTANYEAFRPDDAKDFDVVILDWPSIYSRDENGKLLPEKDDPITSPHAPQIGKDYARPTILIGSVAGTIGRQLNLAIDWKCLCLENFAHDLVETHTIFHEPLPVDLQMSEHAKPLDYYLHLGTEKLGESIRVWKVQTKTFPEIDPGLVSSRENFTDTPDAEVISGGFNGKGPTSVAIGRHANYLQWGFSADPTDMTDSAKNTFINAVCYIHKFDGHQAGPVQQPNWTREQFVERIYGLRGVTEPFLEKQVADLKEKTRDNQVWAEAMKQIGDDPAAYFKKMEEPFVKSVMQEIPQSVRDQCHDDPEQLAKYYGGNLEYLRRSSDSLAAELMIDEDVRALGISNRKPAFLEKCIAMLEMKDDPDRAQRLLERYTGRHWKTAPEWRNWLDEEGDKLQFDESKGVFARAQNR